MKILVDTQIFLWAITGDARLSARQRELYEDPDNELYFSLASLWEILIKVGIGKLGLPQPAAEYLRAQIEKNRLALLTLRFAHMAELEKLPPVNRDPFDRMLAAQARAEGIAVLTADPVFAQYGVAAR